MHYYYPTQVCNQAKKSNHHDNFIIFETEEGLEKDCEDKSFKVCIQSIGNYFFRF